MKLIKCKILLVILVLLVGCSNRSQVDRINVNTISADNQQENEIDKLNQKILILENEQRIDQDKISQLENKAKIYEDVIASLENQIKEYKHELSAVEQRFNVTSDTLGLRNDELLKLKGKINDLIDADERIISIDELNEKSDFDGFIIADLKTDDSLHMSLVGYFLAEGTFAISEMTGELFFYGKNTYPKDVIFETKVKFPNSEFFKEFNTCFEVRYDKEQLKSDVGEGIYKQLEDALKKNDISFSFSGTALFNSFSVSQKYDGGGITIANLVEIVEIKD